MTREQARQKACQIFAVQSPSDSICAKRSKEETGFWYEIYLLRNDKSQLGLGSGPSWDAALDICRLVADLNGRWI